MRVGIGHDTHRLVKGRPLMLGGVKVSHSHGLAGHSDADVVLHALADALLGAAALGDIGDMFPDSDPNYEGVDSGILLRAVVERVRSEGWQPANVDLIIHAQRPKLGSHKLAIRDRIAELLGVPSGAVSVKAKTGEGVGPIGRGMAISCEAVVLVKAFESTIQGTGAVRRLTVEAE
jgi:2-C-methyl-D-erythritol 2,4-cyclodiphosphate synthase